MDLSKLATETRNPNSMNLDTMSALEIATVMNSEDAKVPVAIQAALPQIAQAIEWARDAFLKGGRLIYMGAGTSGRLGVLDASECPPTFGVPEGQVVGIIAGGEHALRHAVEDAEDNAQQGKQDLVDINLTKNDVLVGIAASGRTPYVIGGLEYANSLGCNTVSVVCNNGSAMAQTAKLAIEVVVGPEVVTGSTRLKSGTAQKLVLNMLSSGGLILTGKVYQNLMVDVMQSNKKLQVRAENIVMEATGTDRENARKNIDLADGSVKTAIVMILLNCDKDAALRQLENAGGHVRKAIQ